MSWLNDEYQGRPLFACVEAPGLAVGSIILFKVVFCLAAPSNGGAEGGQALKFLDTLGSFFGTEIGASWKLALSFS
jgi:hypothetical protein